MIQTDNKQTLDAELGKNKRTIVLFYASWCPYCIRFVPVFDKNVINLGKGSVIHVLLDDYDNPLWDDYSIGAVPTIILFEDGKVQSRLDASLGLGLSERKFYAWLEELNNS